MMSRLSPADLDELRARNPLSEVAGHYVRLRRAGGRLVGPCPMCGGKAASQRFEILHDGESWVCAVCGDGGDVIRLIEKAESCDFLTAVEKLGGRTSADPRQAAELFEAREKKRRAREKTAALYREAERRRLWRLWNHKTTVKDIFGTPVDAYLAGRGLSLPPKTPGLRYLPRAPYWHGESVDSRTGHASPRCIHSGPAMAAAFVRADGTFGGLHLTWLAARGAIGDPEPAIDARGQIWEKIELADPDSGELLPAKKMRGSKTGAFITVAPLIAAPARLVIGEGIETVLAVYTAHVEMGRAVDQTAFWAAGDLGNLAGRAAESLAHPSLKRPDGRAQRVPGPMPDPDDLGIAIPDSVRELILLGDGDSDPVMTRYAMERAARRYAKDGREIRIAFAPRGSDFNDVLRRGFDAALRSR